MKKLAALGVLIALSVVGFSQVFTLGPKAGINYSKLKFDENFISDGVDFTLKTDDPELGIVAGGFIQLNAGPFVIQPEVLYSQDRTNVRLNSMGVDELHEIKINKLDVPLLVGFNLGDAIRLQAGPVMTNILNATITGVTEESYEVQIADYKKRGWGYQVGLGFDVSRVSFDIRYESNLRKQDLDISMGGLETFDLDYKDQVIQATIGFMLF